MWSVASNAILKKASWVFAKVEVLTTDTAINQEDRYIVQFAMAYRKPGSKFTILEKLDLGFRKNCRHSVFRDTQDSEQPQRQLSI